MQKHNIIHTLISLAAIISISYGCRTALKRSSLKEGVSPPQWTVTGRHTKYPDSFYMTAIGSSASSRQEADDNARKELAKEIQVHLKGVDESVQSEISSGNGESSAVITYSDTVSGIAAKVDITLEGVSVRERRYDKDKGIYHSLAVLNRDQAAGRIERELSESLRSITNSYNRGKRFEEAHDYLSCLRNYIHAYNESQKISLLPLILDVVRGGWKGIEKHNNKDTGSHDIRARIEDIVSNLRIVKVAGDNQVGRDNMPMEEPFKAQVIYSASGSEFPVKNMPMAFSFKVGEGSFDRERVVTDRNGMASTQVNMIRSAGEGSGVILLEFDIARLAGGLSDGPADTFLKNLPYAAFSYTIPIIFSSEAIEPQDKDTAIKSLVSRIINNIKGRGKLTFAVADFTELRSRNRLRFSNILESELKTMLAQAQNMDIEVRDRKTEDVPFILTGGYLVESRAIKIDARLVDTASGNIISAAQARIRREGVPEMEFIVDGVAIADKEYPPMIDRLINIGPEDSQFRINIWTERKEYEIGETVTFYFRAERDCYLTLLDIGTSGRLTFLFPNSFHQDNFIRAGATYSIPGEGYGFNINVEGPPGLERIKAIASARPFSLTEMNFKDNFFGFDSHDSTRTRDLTVSMDSLSERVWSEGLHEIFIRPQKGATYRGSREVIIKPPQKPIDIIGTIGAAEEKGKQVESP